MVIKTSDHNVIKTNLEQTDTETLVIFDVDEVLFQPRDQILQSPYCQNLKQFEKIIDKSYPENIANELYSSVWLQRKIEPIHRNIISTITQAQQKGIRVLALTNCITGRFGHILSVEDWRIQDLKILGYHFDKSWQGAFDKSFHQLPSRNSESYSCFKSGVIFANTLPKGQVLRAFLDCYTLNPSHIIFIDDLAINLNSVEAAVSALNIPFVGIEYTAVADSKIEPLNKARAEFQFVMLEKERKWLSDAEADQRMGNAFSENA